METKPTMTAGEVVVNAALSEIYSDCWVLIVGNTFLFGGKISLRKESGIYLPETADEPSNLIARAIDKITASIREERDLAQYHWSAVVEVYPKPMYSNHRQPVERFTICPTLTYYGRNQFLLEKLSAKEMNKLLNRFDQFAYHIERIPEHAENQYRAQYLKQVKKLQPGIEYKVTE